VSEHKKISEGVYTTGEIGTWIKEQSLVVSTNQDLVIITG
jgi:7,8-dihydropterin-6-yl-methyl-4-(beta-D-ribofuranosyl)aminobenzene 5'-phosphate synthase